MNVVIKVVCSGFGIASLTP
nr:hypothetical protein [Vibrio alginolyticus]